MIAKIASRVREGLVTTALCAAIVSGACGRDSVSAPTSTSGASKSSETTVTVSAASGGSSATADRSTDKNAGEVAPSVQPVRFPIGNGPQGIINFPPRNEPNAFFADLQALYRDVLRRAEATSFVDAEGQNVWLTEYFRFYLNGCSHEEAIARTLREISSGGTQPVCGAETLAFPPRNLPNDFQNRLEATYRDVLRRAQVPTFVDSEGANVWLAQYLRFRVSGCDHLTAQNKVFSEIRGGGVQPVCTTNAPPNNTNLTGSYTATFNAASSCTQIPAARRSRTLAASLTRRNNAPTFFDVVFSGANFLGQSGALNLIGNDVSGVFVFGETLASGDFLLVDALTGGVRSRIDGFSIVGSFGGTWEYVSFFGQQFRCVSTAHQMRFDRR